MKYENASKIVKSQEDLKWLRMQKRRKALNIFVATSERMELNINLMQVLIRL